MDKTLFTPAMIETFKSCRLAYQQAFGEIGKEPEVQRASNICKKFMLKALVEINRGRITTVNQVQKFMGQNWPMDRLNPDEAVKAFLFTYKSLMDYVSRPYHPDGAEVVGVGLKVRARIPHERVYIEDTFDLILWYPKERKLEFVDYHLNPLKPIRSSWPTASILVKQFLADRLRCRWPFEKLVLTFSRISPHGFSTTTITPDESIYRGQWEQLLNTVREMKSPDISPSPHSCPRCQNLEHPHGLVREPTPISRTA